MANCQHAFYKRADVSVHCRLLEQQKAPFTQCGLQKFCPDKRMWVCTEQSARCALKDSSTEL